MAWIGAWSSWHAAECSQAGVCDAQAATRPPTFVCFVNEAGLFTDEYRRYLERQLRDNVGFPGTPLRIYFRGKPPRTGPGGGRPAAAAE